MRVSTMNLFNAGLAAMERRQSELTHTSLQLASGQRILAPADDPSGAVRAMELEAAIAQTGQYQENTAAAQSHLNITEGALNAVVAALQQVRELTIAGNNSPLSDSDRAAIAGEARQVLDELLDLANTKDANGEYLFAGLRSHTQPFATDGAGNYVYAGDSAQRQIQIGPNRFVAWGDSGAAVFSDIPSGNGTFATAAGAANTGTGVIDAGALIDAAAYVADDYSLSFTSASAYEVRDSGGVLIAGGAYNESTPINFRGIQASISGAPAAGDTFTFSQSQSQDLFTTVGQLAEALESPIRDGADTARLNNAVNRALTDLDQALENVNSARAGVGTRLQALESQQDLHEGSILDRKNALSGIKDLDYAEAIGRLQLQRTGLQAAQQVFAQLYRLSLFDFIR